SASVPRSRASGRASTTGVTSSPAANWRSLSQTKSSIGQGTWWVIGKRVGADDDLGCHRLCCSSTGVVYLLSKEDDSTAVGRAHQPFDRSRARAITVRRGPALNEVPTCHRFAHATYASH